MDSYEMSGLRFSHSGKLFSDSVWLVKVRLGSDGRSVLDSSSCVAVLTTVVFAGPDGQFKPRGWLAKRGDAATLPGNTFVKEATARSDMALIHALPFILERHAEHQAAHAIGVSEGAYAERTDDPVGDRPAVDCGRLGEVG